MTKEKKVPSRPKFEELDPRNIPAHIAIIMDGNRRWARKNFLTHANGHYRGVKTLTKTIKSASQLGVKIITVYAFSTENWNRPKYEVKALMELFRHYLISLRDEMKENDVKLSVIGDISRFSPDIINEIHNSIEYTKNGSKIRLVLALNYGGRDEIKRAFKRLLEAYKSGLIQENDITEELIKSYLDTNFLPDPDLLIRTSGEQRVSNFLLWQISYSEIYTTEKFWPEFEESDLIDAIIDYQRRQRRRGR